MKKNAGVVCFLFSLFLATIVGAQGYTYDGDFDPNRLLSEPEWEWVIVKAFPDGKFLVRSKNPKAGELPHEVKFLAEGRLDAKFKKMFLKIHLYILDFGGERIETYRLNKEHFEKFVTLDTNGAKDPEEDEEEEDEDVKCQLGENPPKVKV